MGNTHTPPYILCTTKTHKVGEVVAPREMRLAVYQRGVAGHVRKVVWKHLLGVYPSGMDGRERVRYIKRRRVVGRIINGPVHNMGRYKQV